MAAANVSAEQEEQTANPTLAETLDDADCDADADLTDFPISPTKRSEDLAEGFEAGGFESGYETDPVERFFVIRKWQAQLDGLQRRLRLHRGGASRREHGDTGKPPGQGTFMRNLRQRRKEVADKLQDGRRKVVGTIENRRKEVAGRLSDGRKKVVGSIEEHTKQLEKQYLKQIDEITEKMDNVLGKFRHAKARQTRHMLCFCSSMAHIVVISFWLGASPSTFHRYYTFQCAALIGCRAVWYRWHGWHYFLFDLCYFCNGVVLLYLWVFPHVQEFFMAAFGFSGVLLISVPVFRNSFVPHSLDKVTSVAIHIGPAVSLWALRWFCNGPGSSFNIPDSMSVKPTVCFYFLWLSTYVLHQFVFGRKFIEKRGYATLFQHMAYDMGILAKLPKRLQGPVGSRTIFVLGHFALFLSGLPYIFLPFALQTLVICVATLWAFKNGAAFYITYFWKVYENQIFAFEKDMVEAQAAADEVDKATASAPEAQPSESQGGEPDPTESQEGEPDPTEAQS